MKIWTPFKRIATPQNPALDNLLEEQYSIGFADGFVSASVIAAAFILTSVILSAKK